MASVPKPQHQLPSASKPPTNPNPSSQILSRASHLTRSEVIRRRSQYLKRLSRCYRDHYWALMEDVKLQHRHYYWKYGVSPFKEDGNIHRELGESGLEGTGENINSNAIANSVSGCSFVGCKLKPMALTRFCHLHILSDSNQKLYIPCSYVIKSAHAGNITCGKPILRSIQPTLCSVHFYKAQKHVTRALKKAGLNVNSSSKLAPKFHVLVAEYVCQIQTHRRRAACKDKGEVEAQTTGAY